MKKIKIKYGMMIMLTVLVTSFSPNRLFSQQRNILYVKHPISSTDAWQGRSSVYTSITDAIDAASAGCDIWVAKGRYQENIELKDGIRLYGGFEGDETSLADRDDIWNDIAMTTIDGRRQARCILTASNNVIDGFKLIYGKADWGAGIGISNNAGIEIRNIFIESCQVSWAGAGILVDSPRHGGHILVEGVVMWKCEAGCGVFEITESTSAQVTVRNCTIVQNHAKGLEIPYHDGVVPANQHHEFYNNILWGNQCSTYPTEQVDVWSWARDYTDYSYIGKARWHPTTNKWGEPLTHNLFESEVGQPGFVDPDHGDFRLQSTSRCVGKGKDGSNMGAMPVQEVTTPQVSVSSTELDFGHSHSSLTFTIRNIGGGTLHWNASENPDKLWLASMAPNSGTLGSGDSQIITLNVDRNQLTGQNSSTQIIIQSNGGEQVVLVNINKTLPSNLNMHVNCGNYSNYIDHEGNVWSADQPYTAGNWGFVGGNEYTTSDPIANTSDYILYQAERWGLDSYKFDLENGEYEVTLLFAELYFKESNQRIFNVEIENSLVLKDYHLFEEAGHDCATSKKYHVTVLDNQLNINFITSAGDPTICGIELNQVNNPGMLTSFMKVNYHQNTIETPEAFKLCQNYPNPFNGSTHISFEIPMDCQVQFSIYNITGQLVRNVLGEHFKAGKYHFNWNGTDNHGQNVTSGTYLGVLKANSYQQTITMTLLK